MRQYVSLPLIAANVAVVLLGAGAFAALRPALPERMAMQFDGRGNVSRWGSPAELWLIFGIELFNLALLAFITWSVSAERWALPENEPARYAAAQLRRRRLIVRLVETLMLGINLSTTLIWIGLAVGALPGYGGILAWAIVAGVTFTGLAVILPLVGFIRPLARVQKELAEIAGTHVLGTRATGWRWAGMIYYAPEDPALFVPKFRGIGQTLNFARPMSWVLLIGSIAVPLVLSAVVLAFAK